jgi:DNA-nicking Smr family endonuclease
MHSDRRRRLLTHDELRLWRDAMQGAEVYDGRLSEDGSLPPPQPLAPLPKSDPRPRDFEPPPGGPGTAHSLDHGRTAGVDRRTADKMKRGEMTIDGDLDLHGMTRDAAHGALARFLRYSYDHGRRCLLVVTGKGMREGGGGVLRAEVPRWLNEPGLRPMVLAFAHAQPRHGGEGALYVLLKRRR